MQVQVDISFENLIKNVKQSPKDQLLKFKKELDKEIVEGNELKDLKLFLLDASVFTDEQTRKKSINDILKIDMDIHKIINVDPDILGGQQVFAGTRVPVDSLFDHLEAGVSLDEFLEDFPSVKKEQAISLLEFANKIISSKDIAKLYEAVA